MAQQYRDIGLLVPEMESRARDVKVVCEEEGVDLLIYCTIRTLAAQARAWRKSRRTSEIHAKTDSFLHAGYDLFAQAIIGVGPQSGRIGEHVTMAAPGETWHNYGEAFDSVPLIDGKIAEWNDHVGYSIYGAACRKVGLFWGGRWRSLSDSPHAQMRDVGNPLKIYRPEEAVEKLSTVT